MQNYCQGAEIDIQLLAHKDDGTLDLKALEKAAGSCGVYLEQPNPLGVLDEGLSRSKTSLENTRRSSLAFNRCHWVWLRLPVITGADIVVGEGQPSGSPVTGGGRSTESLLARNRTSGSCRVESSVVRSMLMEKKPTA